MADYSMNDDVNVVLKRAGGNGNNNGADIYADWQSYRRFPEDIKPDSTYFSEFGVKDYSERGTLQIIFEGGPTRIRGVAALIRKGGNQTKSLFEIVKSARRRQTRLYW